LLATFALMKHDEIYHVGTGMESRSRPSVRPTRRIRPSDFKSGKSSISGKRIAFGVNIIGAAMRPH
jgi:hypothetical protein